MVNSRAGKSENFKPPTGIGNGLILTSKNDVESAADVGAKVDINLESQTESDAKSAGFETAAQQQLQKKMMR